MIDQAVIVIKSGKGGDGAISGRREKFVPRGGPDGGDGGRGGDVYFEVDENISTLTEFQYKKQFHAEIGGNGAGALKHGKDGIDIIVKIPLGTEAWEAHRDDGEDALVGDLITHGERVLIAKGGRGGRGNSRFATSTNRFPMLAEQGELGEERVLRLELKLLADVGLVGLPNAGKSSLLAAVSAARPKIAAYPFTTLEPVLGVVEHKNNDFVVVDIPGLIEGAHQGIGLGHEFLRHIERTKILVHVVDITTENPVDDIEKINTEMRLFNARLAEVPQIVALNKIDIPETESNRANIMKLLKADGKRTVSISAAARHGIATLLDMIIELLDEAAPAKENHPTETENRKDIPTLRPKPERRGHEIEQRGDVFVVTSREAGRIAAMVDETNWAARTQFYGYLKRIGVTKQLESLGIHSGQKVRVGKFEWEWE